MFMRVFITVTILASCVNAEEQKPMSWSELTEQFECPAWYRDAKFGIWAHWGAQSKPARGGGWYARHMYYSKDRGMPRHEHFGKEAYEYHKKTYGHPSEQGFKDVLHEWKAEKLDTDALLKYFKQCGAKYFVALANHHDHFDNFDSTYHSWNSVNNRYRDRCGTQNPSANLAEYYINRRRLVLQRGPPHTQCQNNY